jgi:hypothetical protein
VGTWDFLEDPFHASSFHPSFSPNLRSQWRPIPFPLSISIHINEANSTNPASLPDLVMLLANVDILAEAASHRQNRRMRATRKEARRP